MRKETSIATRHKHILDHLIPDSVTAYRALASPNIVQHFISLRYSAAALKFSIILANSERDPHMSHGYRVADNSDPPVGYGTCSWASLGYSCTLIVVPFDMAKFAP